MPDAPFFSVIVCSRDRSDQLARAGRALLEMDYAPDRWELLIVDNGSRDDTQEVARRLAREAPMEVRIVEEPEPGLSLARNTGIRQARGALLAFIDDDATPCPSWLTALEGSFVRNGAAVLGGPVDLRFSRPRPSWLEDSFLPFLSEFDEGPGAHRLSYPEYPRGTNFAVRREAFEEVGDFSSHLGRKGGLLRSGEEIELCLRLARSGRDIVYVPEAKVVHHVSSERLTPNWFVQRYREQGFSEAIIEWRHGGTYAIASGWRRHRAHVATFRKSRYGSPLLIRCLRSALRGYLRGASFAVLHVPRYAPRNGARAFVRGRAPAPEPASVRAIHVGSHVVDAARTPDVSIIIPTRNGGRVLERCLEAVFSQESRHPFEVLCVDSGSDENTLAILRRYPLRLIPIDPATFNHGLTRDLGAQHGRGGVLVFLNQDAVPCDERWLETLIEPLLAPSSYVAIQGGIREIPRKKERFYWDSCGERFYFTRESRNWIARHDNIGFATGNAAIRREIWERYPFGWAPIMEDKKWQGIVTREGYRIALRDEAAVYHSHDYDLRALVRRCISEGFGWKLVGERYGLLDAVKDSLQVRIYRDLLTGLRRRQVRTAAELFFPWIRPASLYYGNRFSRDVRL